MEGFVKVTRREAVEKALTILEFALNDDVTAKARLTAIFEAERLLRAVQDSFAREDSLAKAEEK